MRVRDLCDERVSNKLRRHYDKPDCRIVTLPEARPVAALPFEPLPEFRAGLPDDAELADCRGSGSHLIVTYTSHHADKVLRRITPNVWRNVEQSRGV